MVIYPTACSVGENLQKITIASPEIYVLRDLDEKGFIETFSGKKDRLRHECNILFSEDICAIQQITLGKYCDYTIDDVKKLLKNNEWPTIPVN